MLADFAGTKVPAILVLNMMDVMIASKTGKRAYTKFDRIALSPVRGKIIAIGIILGVFFAAMLFAGIFGGLASVIIKLSAGGVQSLLEGWHAPELLVSLICDVLFSVVYFAVIWLRLYWASRLGLI